GADNVSNVENFRFSGPVTVAVANLISLQSDGDADADSVAENAANGSQVQIDVNAAAGVGASISYSIVSGNADSAFAIDAATGIVTVANATLLDFETQPSRAITIRATATGGDFGSFTDKSYTISVTNANEAPVINEPASDLAPSGDEDTDITGAIVATDVDPDILTYAVQTGGEPANGSVIFTGNSYSYTSDADFNGADSFTVLVSDGAGGTDTVIVNVTVNSVNDPPTAVNDTASTDEDVTANGDVLSNDTDPDTGDTKTVTQVNGLAGNVGVAVLLTYGHLTISSNGGWSFVTDTAAAQALNDLDTVQETVSYQMRDAAGSLSSATLQITINGKDEVVTGTNGNDNPLAGVTPYDDQAFGLDGDDVIDSLSGDDEVFGGNGNDILTGSAGSDQLDGGAQTDTASYANASSGVFADLSTGIGTYGDAEGDAYISIENLTGSAFGDHLYGNGLDNVLTGGDGNDVLRGGAGADELDGGAGVADYAIYVDAAAEVTIDLENMALNTGDAAGDTYIGIERFQLTNFDDVFSGDSANNIVYGLDGDDQLSGRGGDDHLNGGAGADAYDGGAGAADYASYVNATGAVTVDFTNLAANTGDAAGDTFVNIEGYQLTNFNDTFKGSAAGETIRGFEGADFLSGRGGRDILRGDGGVDTFIFTAIADSGLGAARDVVQDFVVGTDKLDVSVIDAASAAGVQDFSFIGTASFTAEGQVRAVQSGGNTILEFNTAGTTGAEMSIQLNVVTATALTSSDFIF
ncbi:MAG: Ig-like domain-containing protein, partial [Aestuariivirga sp.]